MRCSQFALFVAAAGMAGCQSVGPNSISYGRVSYNQVIQETSNQQVFMNLMRVRNNEPTLFMDVTEVDSQLQILGTLTHGVNTVSAGTHSSGITLQYSESPTVRYLPVVGPAFAAQLSRPVDVESIAALPDSITPFASLMAFTVNYLTPTYGDKDLALNALIRLDSEGVIAMSAGHSAWPPSKAKTPAKKPSLSDDEKASSSNEKSPPPNDTLILFFEPDRPRSAARLLMTAKEELELYKTNWRLWIRLSRIFCSTQPDVTEARCSEANFERMDTQISEAKTPKDMQVAGVTLNIRRWLEIRTAPLAPNPAQETSPSLSPIMRTRSAMGILKAMNAVPLAKVVSEKQYSEITKAPWNVKDLKDDEPEFYTLVPYVEPICSKRPSLCVDEKKREISDEGGETALSEWRDAWKTLARPNLLTYSVCAD